MAETPVLELLKATKRLGMFLEALVGSDRTPTSWMFDPGCEVSQISWATAQSVWSSITPLGSARLKCTMAISTTTADLQLVRLSDFRLTDLTDPRILGNSVSIEVMINPCSSLYFGVELYMPASLDG